MPNNDMSPFKSALLEFGEFTLELGKVVLISLAIILPVRYFVVQPFYVNGQSMEPTFENNEYLLIDEISYRLDSPKRGDVVVFRYPRDTSKFFIKRLIGLPGETVRIENGQVQITNAEHPQSFTLDEPYLNNNPTLGEYSVSVPEEQYFFLGDNRDESLDSRVFGPVFKHFVVGRVWLRAFPLSRWAIFGGNTVNGQSPVLK